MANTENLDLKTNILGIGTNAESAIAENMRKIDAAFGEDASETALSLRLADIESRLAALEGV